MSDDEKLAERIARAQIGKISWLQTSDSFRRDVCLIWREQIKTIRAAGLAVVEAEDGR